MSSEKQHTQYSYSHIYYYFPIQYKLQTDLIHSVAKTGGHLGSSLGVVELTVALHHVFNTPDDKIIWDVGHQAYIHKMLTGRRNKMSTIRQSGGLSGTLHVLFSQQHLFTYIKLINQPTYYNAMLYRFYQEKRICVRSLWRWPLLHLHLRSPGDGSGPRLQRKKKPRDRGHRRRGHHGGHGL